MARLRKLGKKGNYYAIFYDATKTPPEKSYPLRTNRKDVALTRFHRACEEYDRGRLDPWNPRNIGQKPLTLTEAKKEFLSSRSHRRPHTVRTYDDVLRWLGDRLPPFILLRDISGDHLKPFIHDSTVSNASQRKRHTHLRAFFKWAVKTGHIKVNPLSEVDTPKEQKRVPEFLTASQLDRLLTAIDTDYEMKQAAFKAYGSQITWLKDVVVLAVGTGMRQAELLNLKWRSVDFENGFIILHNRDGFLTKDGDERPIPLVGPALEVLTRLYAQRADDGYVLKGQRGGRLNGNHVSRRFKYYVRLAKLPENIHFHSLRHTCASWLVQRGISLEIIAAILGHSDTRVTKRYSHLAPNVLQKAMQTAFGA